MRGAGTAIRSVVVAGELTSFLEAAKQMGAELPWFMSAYQQFVQRHLHSRPLFSKFLGDRFVFVYESASPSFAANVVQSAMVLEGAFRAALKRPVPGFETLSTEPVQVETLNLGVSGGRLFQLQTKGPGRDQLIGLPFLAAQSLAERADSVRSHILVDVELELDRVCQQYFTEQEGAVETSSDTNEYDAHIVTVESMLRAYRNDRDRYEVVNAVEALKAEIDEVAQVDVFSFRLERSARPHLELVFNPLNHRGKLDRGVSSSILLAHVTPTVMTLYPEILIPTDRVYTVQLPLYPVDDYQIVIGLVIQSPETDLIGEELQKIQGSDEICAAVEALRSIFRRAVVSDRLSHAYYRF